jgi:hypothetical protein
VNYYPLKGMLILILSLKLSIVPYEAGPEVNKQGSKEKIWLPIVVK